MGIKFTESQKQQISDRALIEASGILAFAMHLIDAENFIQGEVDYGLGEKFKLKFERINSSNIESVSGDQG